MTDNTSSSRTKKRKVNDGRDDVPDDSAYDVSNGGGFFSSWFGYFSGRGYDAPSERNSKTQLDRMEQMMMRMEERLATVSSLERRCEQLEAKCSSLESKLEDKVDSLQGKVDRAMKYHEYNTMLVKNQSWEYSSRVDSYYWLNDEEAAEYLVRKSEELKEKTIKMRRGEFPDDEEEVEGGGNKGISLCMFEYTDQYSDGHFLVHWREFAAALKQFAPAMNLLPDDCESFFVLNCRHRLNIDMMLLMKDALIGKPFTDMTLERGMDVDTIMDIVESNKHLRKLAVHSNRIQSTHVDRLCNIVHNYPLVELDLWNSINDSTIGNAMLTSLLTSGDLKLENLGFSDCNITSDVIPLLADFIASNPRLKELNLEDNYLDNNDAALIANALRSNTTLQQLYLGANIDITDDGFEAAFRPVLCDESSLNAVADSNHCCLPELHAFAQPLKQNSSNVLYVNRGRKIYNLLAKRQLSETMSNVQHFRDIDVKVLPYMLEAVQRYSTIESKDDKDDPGLKVGSLSIVYEVMRKWDKVFSIYTSEDVE